MEPEDDVAAANELLVVDEMVADELEGLEAVLYMEKWWPIEVGVLVRALVRGPEEVGDSREDVADVLLLAD